MKNPMHPAGRLLLIMILTLAGAACGGGKGEAENPEHADEHSEAGNSDEVVLTEAAMRTVGIAVEPVQMQSEAASGEALEVPGQVAFDPRRVALASPRVAGRIERTLVVEGDRVQAGQPVALIFAPAYVTAQNEFVHARRRAQALAGTPDGSGAEALLEAAARRLRYLGVADAEVARLMAGGDVRELLPLPAPISGSVVETTGLPGAAIESGSPVFRIADLSSVDVLADVPERSIRLVSVGQRAVIRLQAYPGQEFTGRVERIEDELDSETRSVHAVIDVPNRTRILRPGMFATVRLDVPYDGSAATDAQQVLTIPQSAVVTDGEARYVFVQVAPRTFQRREVRVTSLAPAGSATSVSGRLAVWEGLAAGEKVVVRGAFTLKSELAKAALAEDEH